MEGVGSEHHPGGEAPEQQYVEGLNMDMVAFSDHMDMNFAGAGPSDEHKGVTMVGEYRVLFAYPYLTGTVLTHSFTPLPCPHQPDPELHQKSNLGMPPPHPSQPHSTHHVDDMFHSETGLDGGSDDDDGT
jgi:hypothetical protein